MKKIINVFVFIMMGLSLSCGLDTEDEGITEPEPVKFRHAIPERGSLLHFDESITIFFNRIPETLIVVPGTVATQTLPLLAVIPKMATVCLIWQVTFWSGALTNTMQIFMVFLKVRTRYRVQTHQKR